jgi:SAM-dependent methyltransferase
VLGVDLSPGMLHAARDRIARATSSTPAQVTDSAGSAGSPAAAPAAHSPAAAPGSPPVPAVPGLAVADATALPLPAGATDVAMAPHMLYHVPDPAAAVRELRRVTRPGGQVLVVLNGEDHLRELREQVADALGDTVIRGRERITLDTGAELLARCFDSVVRHDFTAELVVPGPEPVAAYLLSSRAAQHAPEAQRLVARVLGGLPTDQAGNFRIQTHSGCLVCR